MKKKYSSDNGFMTSIWGPMLWSLLHIISMNYPVKPSEEEKIHYYDFVLSLQHVLPCGACRVNMIKNLDALKFNMKHMQNRSTFSKFIFTFHQEVNRMLGKDFDGTFNDVRDVFELFRARCGKSKESEESGCILPVNNVKSKCIISIVPQDTVSNSTSIHIDHRCLPK
jgi:hypothetical protein